MPKNWMVLLLFALGTALLYFPVLGNGFLTDDYASLYRILIEKRMLYRELLRPLIDISFYLNFLVCGLHPLGYYIFNLCVHALTCYMVYRVALDLPLFTASRKVGFAMTAGLLFLFYPFHNEGVVWLSGRLSSMAALFGLLAIHFSLTRAWPWNFLLAALFWVIGLFAYESIIVLPAVILLFEWMKYRDVGRGLRSAAAWCLTGLLWLVMRWLVAGSLLPEYGKEGMPGDKGDGYLLRLIKVVGRCFLPPFEASRVLIFLFVGVVVVIVLLHFLFWRRRTASDRRGRPYLTLEAILFLSLLPAILFGVSTRTAEGDRLLYFPSCFLCLLASALLYFFFDRQKWRLLLCAVFAIGSVVFIEANNQRWVFASRTAATFLDTLRAAPGRVVLVNAPDEWEGAFIFRNNFKPGLVVNGIDTNKVWVSHFLMRLDYLPVAGPIGPVRKDAGMFIYPGTAIEWSGARFWVRDLQKGVTEGFDAREDRVYYWDKFALKRLILPQSESLVR